MPATSAHHARGPRVAAEAVGTFLLVALGPGAAAVDVWSGGTVTHVGVALTFGTVILAAVYALGHISGAHLNPAVTMGFWLARRFPRADVLPYVAAQLFGATAAGLGIRAAVGHADAGALTVPLIGVLPALGVEVVLTFALMLVVMAVATDARVEGVVAGLAVGSIVAADALAGGPLTGASMNPARSFGPALAAGVWTAHWIYWVGPLIGAALGVGVYDYLRTGHAHDHRIAGRPLATTPRAVPLHGELGPEPDGRGVSEFQSDRAIPR
jgi:MIP family channel proteins